MNLFSGAVTAQPLSRARNLLVGLLATAFVVAGLALPAAADATPGLTLNVSYGTTTAPDGTTVITPGTQYVATIQYQRTALVAGSTLVLVAPAGITIPDSALVVPVGNTVFESMSRQPDGSIAIKIINDLSGSSVNQGVFDMSFTVDNPAGGSEVRPLTWSFAGVSQTVTVIVKKTGDEILQPFSEREAKSVSNAGSLNNFVTVSGGVVTVDPAIANVNVHYTLNVDSPAARTGIDISDTLDPRLEYVTSSFAANLTTWDSNGLNKTTTTLAATPTFGTHSFTYSAMDLPLASKLAITYDARLSSAAIAQLQADLQASYNLIDPAVGGTFSSSSFLNTLAVTGVAATPTQSFTISRTVTPPAGPNYGSAFAKSSSLSNNTVVSLDSGGNLAAPVAVTYTLGAHLSYFTGAVPALDRNVVVTDTLPSQVTWLSSDPAFIVVKDEANNPVTLTQVSGLSAADFATDANIGKYQVAGQALWINFGHDSAHDYSAAVKAQVVSLAGISTTSQPSSLPTVQTRYNGPKNSAIFTFSNSIAAQTMSVTDHLVVLRDPSVPITDTNKFTKTAPATVTGAPGSAITIPFTFKVNAGYDFAQSRIVDLADPAVFDLSDLNAIKAGITGMYNYNGPLTGASFDLALDSDGHLVLTPSATFTAGWPSWMSTSAPYNKYMTVTVPIPTKALIGSQTIKVTNTALLEGSSADTWTYTSTAGSSGTTYGDEMEVYKALYNEGQWTGNLRAQVDGAGKLINDTFIYRVELIPHGSFNHVTIIPVLDALPTGLDFLGFVSDANLATGTLEPGNTVAMGGNIQAEWIAATRTLNMYNPSGTKLNAGSPIYVNFMVKAQSYSENVGITNAIGNAKATFTPSNGYPLVIQKQDANDASAVINDRGARFTITGPAGVVTDSAYVVEGLLMVSDGKGGDKGIVVADKGTYTVTETLAPVGFALAKDPVTVTVGSDGNAPAVTYYNTRVGASDMGTVSLSKTVTGGPDGSGTDFTFSWTAVPPAGEQLTAAQSAGSVVVKGDGVPVALGISFPAGSVVTFAEGKAPYINGYNVTDVKYSVNPVAVTSGEDARVDVVNTYAFPLALAHTGADQTGLRVGIAAALTMLGAVLLGARRWRARRTR